MMAKQHFWFVYFNFGSDFGLGLIHCHSKLSLFRSRFERRKKERERENHKSNQCGVVCGVRGGRDDTVYFC